ncbi:MAG TPA: efflux RND transporter periplasmic adaptor subunit [Dongiaceae bacterium]|nr:efflux RND transporter periplasmic adaptor subunit [Dongiaceae bacterium]
MPVETVFATRQDVPVYLTGLGTVQALNTVVVTARVDGQVQKIGFSEGQDVSAGDLLAQIDPRPFQAALDEAVAKKAQDLAQLTNAQRDLQRFTALSQKQFASQQQLDAERTQVEQLQAQIQGDQAAIDNARTQLDYTSIRAPLSGRAGFRLVDQGNNVHASDTNGIVVITELHPISVVFTLPEENLPAVMNAMSAGTVVATALGQDNKTVLARGKVTIVDNQIDQATGTARFKAEFANDDNALWPGEFVNIRVLQGTERNVLTAPSIALQRGPEGFFTYVVKADNTVAAQPLQVGYDTGQVAVITKGLVPSAQVVTGGQYRLQPGTLVKATLAPQPPTVQLPPPDKAAQGDAEHGKSTLAQVVP